jgi:hypothetical protein
MKKENKTKIEKSLDGPAHALFSTGKSLLGLVISEIWWLGT